mmetsp:Transcript_95312/g.269266  ORF Transcript_95312/g.269266 Transcript_95312/m.269266 type:complete len:240 (-) Transcript_95312:1009-1728(-)
MAAGRLGAPLGRVYLVKLEAIQRRAVGHAEEPELGPKVRLDRGEQHPPVGREVDGRDRGPYHLVPIPTAGYGCTGPPRNGALRLRVEEVYAVGLAADASAAEALDAEAEGPAVRVPSQAVPDAKAAQVDPPRHARLAPAEVGEHGDQSGLRALEHDQAARVRTVRRAPLHIDDDTVLAARQCSNGLRCLLCSQQVEAIAALPMQRPALHVRLCQLGRVHKNKQVSASARVPAHRHPQGV